MITRLDGLRLAWNDIIGDVNFDTISITTKLSLLARAFLCRQIRVCMSHAYLCRIGCGSLLTNRHIRAQMYTAKPFDEQAPSAL